MNLIPKQDFLNLVSKYGLHEDFSGILVFDNQQETTDWLTPNRACDLTGFISTLMKQSSQSGSFYLWLRDGHSWFTGTGFNEGPLEEQIRDRIVGLLPIPKDFLGALRFEQSEWSTILLIVSTFLIYGWCSDDDLQVVSGEGSTAILFNHHSRISVRCKSVDNQASFTSAMNSKGFKVCAA